MPKKALYSPKIVNSLTSYRAEAATTAALFGHFSWFDFGHLSFILFCFAPFQHFSVSDYKLSKMSVS